MSTSPDDEEEQITNAWKKIINRLVSVSEKNLEVRRNLLPGLCPKRKSVLLLRLNCLRALYEVLSKISTQKEDLRLFRQRILFTDEEQRLLQILPPEVVS